MSTYLKHILDAPTPQTEPLDDRQVQNDAGGYVYPVDDAVRMHRFLIMGSENGSYYQNERKLTLDNAAATRRHIATDGLGAVEHIVDVARRRRAPKMSPALFCLALAASADNADTRKAARAALPTVAGTASMLQEFASYVDSMRGWGPSLRKAVAEWYTTREADDVALQAIKYRTRNGWSHRDLLRKGHPKVERNSDLWHIFEWITQGTQPPERESLRFIHAYLKAQTIEDPADLARLITEERLPREAVPPAMLKHDAVWQALGPLMPPLAFVRNLPALTAHNAIRPMAADWAVKRLNSMRARENSDGSSRPAPVHPVNLLLAMMVYRMGRSVDGKNTWKPVAQICDALEDAFHQSFSAAPQTGQRIFLTVDTSGSMAGPELNRIAGLTPRMAAAAICLTVANREPNHMLTACSNRMENLDITSRDSLWDAMHKTQALQFDRTDMALPILFAAENRIPVDCFVIATDGQSFAGSVHPKAALEQYRRKMGIPAKAVQLAFVANRYSIMDPQDAGTLDLVGFDASFPKLLHDFMASPDAAVGDGAPHHEEFDD